MLSFATQVRRRLILAAAASMVLAASVMVAIPALADTAPVSSSEPATVSSDSLPTVQIDGVVWTQVVVGNTVYVGGQFTKARPAGAAAGVNTVSRTNILAYDITTGELIASFNPILNGEVRAMVASADGTKLYVGGGFTTVNGTARNRVALLSIPSGTLDPMFKPSPNATVRALALSSSTLYIGGTLSAVGSVARSKAAAVDATSGALLPWAPAAVGGNVTALAISPDKTKVALGGSFTTLNGGNKPGYGMGIVSSTGTGKTNLPMIANNVVRDATSTSGITSMMSDSDSLYVSGYDFGSGGNFEGTVRLSWTDGSIIWMEDCHGDTYSVFPVNGLVYKSSHAHTCATVPDGLPETNPRTNHYALAFTKSVYGKLTKTPEVGYANYAGQPAPDQVNWYPDFTQGTYTGQDQATWDVSGNSQYVLYGGEFLTVNGKGQQGLARFAVASIAPNKDGPRVSGANWVPTAKSNTAGSITLSWEANYDRDNEKLTYNIRRNGDNSSSVGTVIAESRWFTRPTLTFTDTGLTPGASYSYTIQAIDPFGNVAVSGAVTATVKSGTVINPPPAASFTSSASLLTASFNGGTSSDSNGTISSYAWTFGDGATGIGVAPSHSYSAAGTYTVTLTVTDNGGATGSVSHAISVSTSAVTTLASDAFGRTVSSGWGSADAGGAWTLSGGSTNFAVGSGVGTMKLPAASTTLTAKLSAISSTSTDVFVTTALGQAVSGASEQVSVLGRTIGSNDYRAQLTINSAGKVVMALQRGGTLLVNGSVSGLVYTAGTQVNVRLQVFGTSPTTVRAKVWVGGTAEPASWQLSTTDSTAGLQSGGGIGFAAYLASGSTGLPRSVTFDNLVATPAA